MMKMRQDNDMTDCIGLLYVENETKLKCHDRSNRVRFMTKTKKNKDVTDRIGAV